MFYAGMTLRRCCCQMRPYKVAVGFRLSNRQALTVATARSTLPEQTITPPPATG